MAKRRTAHKKKGIKNNTVETNYTGTKVLPSKIYFYFLPSANRYCPSAKELIQFNSPSYP